MAVNIYTEDFFLENRIKFFLKKVLKRNLGGPLAVFKSLTNGLNELQVPYNLNCSQKNKIHTACVLSNWKTLKWAIQQKKIGKIEKIFAGPNIVVSPGDHQGLLQIELINSVVVPSEWIKDFYTQFSPKLKNKISIWPAGVNVPKSENFQKNTDFLIYEKNSAAGLLEGVQAILKENSKSYEVLKYGQFTQKDYFKFLNVCKYLIYLSPSESQGIAMFEAWARNVPVLAWEPGVYKYQNIEIYGNIATPYLNAESGLRFGNLEEFKKQLAVFLKTNFEPKKYVQNNFTEKICAEKYLKIIND